METVILESRMSSCEDVAERYNTQSIIISKLIEIWNKEPNESVLLFNDIATRIANYDNPTPPSITFNISNQSHRVQIYRRGKKKTLFSSKDIETVKNKRAEWLRFNR